MAKFLLVSFIVLCVSGVCHAQTVSEYTETIVQKALSEKVYDERNWHVLLHYKDTVFKPLNSLVDDERFFLANNGKINPAAELEATIRGILNPDITGTSDKHPYCRFPARREFLEKRLEIDMTQYPNIDCTDYNLLEKKIDPRSVTLIFPFMYINRPASMFGHTLLRINNKYNDPLLSYGVTYAAETPEDPSILDQTVRGLFGVFKGRFTVKEYYKTLFEYSNIDKRDIWEYDLNFTEAESRTMFKHLYELAYMDIDYWFFDENCSYNLLFLLEAARPELMLTTSIFYEAPQNTVKKIYTAGLTGKITYRPSHVKLIENIARNMPKKAIDIGIKVGLGHAPPVTIDESENSDPIKINMYDLAIEVMRYDYLKKDVDEDTLNSYGDKLLEILRGRAAYKQKSDYMVKETSAPHLAHDVSRIKLQTGFFQDRFYTEAGFKLGYHSLEDVDSGYLENTEISVADINIRWDSVKGTIKVQDATILAIGSNPPLSQLSKAVSWRLRVAGEQKSFKDGEVFVPYINGGVGMTVRLFESAYFWLIAMADVSFARQYKSYAGLGLGAEAGISYSFRYGKVLTEGTFRNYVVGGFGNEGGVALSYIIPISRDNSLIAKYEWKHTWGKETYDASLAWRYYF